MNFARRKDDPVPKRPEKRRIVKYAITTTQGDRVIDLIICPTCRLITQKNTAVIARLLCYEGITIEKSLPCKNCGVAIKSY